MDAIKNFKIDNLKTAEIKIELNLFSTSDLEKIEDEKLEKNLPKVEENQSQERKDRLKITIFQSNMVKKEGLISLVKNEVEKLIEEEKEKPDLILFPENWFFFLFSF